MKASNLLLLLIFCFSGIYSTAQSNFDQLIKAINERNADPATNDQLITVENLESVNSEYLDFSPVMHKNGLVFSSNRPKNNSFFGRLFSRLNSNIYYTAEEGSNFFFEAIELPGKVNTSRHEGASTFYANDNAMIYSCNCKNRNALGVYDLKLCSAKFVDGKWIQTEDLPFDTDRRACHPTVSADGSVLIFSAGRLDGLGGMDLYISFFKNGIWQKPQNMGPEINSAKDEVFPTITDEGILVYSSNGLEGCGGLDLFYVEPIAEYTWANPVNFGNPINSNKDDFGFVSTCDGNKGYFSSNRLGGMGQDDIYLWQINELPTQVIEMEQFTTNILILDELTGLPLHETCISLIEINNNLLVTGQLTDEVIIANEINSSLLEMIGVPVEAVATTEKGHKYSIKADHNYFLLITQDGYSNIQKIIPVKHLVQYGEYAVVMNPIQQDLLEGLVREEATNQIIEDVVTAPLLVKEPILASLAIIEPKGLPESEEELVQTTKTASTDTNRDLEVFTSRGVPTELIEEKTNPIDETINTKAAALSVGNIYYEFNKYELTENSKRSVDEVITLLINDDQASVTIQSHTDSRGKAQFNKTLSQRRANAVLAYMIAKGVRKNKVTAIGMGEDYLLNDCGDNIKCDEDYHKKNRRTEFILN